MKRFFAAISFLSLAMLSACGGGSDSSLSPISAAKAATPTTVPIAFFGDSTMWGTKIVNGVGTQTQTPPPAWAQQYLQMSYGQGVTSRNFAVPGTFAAQLVNAWTPYTQNFQAFLYQNQDAKIVVINFAMNDAHLVYVSDYIYAMTQLIQQAQNAGKIVVLEEPNPSCNTDREADLPDFVTAMDNLAAQYNLAVIPQWHSIQQNVSNWPAHLQDCIHPTDDLYQYKGYQEAQVLAPIVAKLLAN